MNQSSTSGPRGAAPQTTNRKFIIGGGVIAVAVIGLVVWAMNRPGATAFYLTTTELVENGTPNTGEDYRVNGNVVPGTVERDGLVTRFAITDGTTEMVIRTGAPLPDAFRDDAETEVVAQGSFDGNTFNASQVLAKCPSKFKAKA
jgi:cytochrome c-type biogenesis protein CcmE